jgi:transglutaminase-like putative cysteine protease
VSERSLVRAAEVALALVTLASILGMSRLFAGGGWLGPLVANAVVAHLVAAALRRRGAPLAVVGVVMAAAAGLVIAWTCYWSTTTLGIPTGSTLDAVRDDLDQAWRLYQDVVAPTPARTGFVVASALAIWVIAYVADWAAFRLWVPFESTLPAATLFLFTALLGTERGRGWAVAVYAGALLGFLLLHRLARQEGTSHWVAERRTAGHRSLLLAGAGLTALAVVAGAVVGPALPGADASGILDPRDLDGDDAPRVTISPLVDIHARLVDQADVEVFTVRSSVRSYWRLTSLERFDGRIWSSSGSYGKAKGDLPESVDIDAATEPIDQSYSISALAAIWLPSAYEPRSFTGEGLDARFDEDSSTLIVSSDVPNSDGLVYQVQSTSPRLTPDDLTGTADEIPGDIRSTYTELPDDFSPDVTDLAEELTAGQGTPYQRSRALQDYLRTFTYDLTVSPGHGGDALEQFLFTTKRGYCEQFAGAFAAMARAIGLPARVAVGFTPGEADPNDPGLYRVRGEHAHAWPEVYFAGAGWVAFEPTPGRGMPAAEPYTGVPEQQAASGRPSDVEVGTVPTTAPAGGTPGTSPDEVDAGGRTPEEEAQQQQSDDEDDDRSWLDRNVEEPVRRIVPWLLAAVALYGIGVPLALAVHRRRRRARATSPDQRIALAWVEAMEDAALVGFRERPSDTYAERAELLGVLLPTAIPSAQALARTRELADYSPEGAGEAEVEAAAAASADVGAAARELAPRSARVRRWLDPRPTVNAWRRDRVALVRRIDTVATGSHDHEGDGRLTGVGVGGRPEPDEG